MTSSLIELTGLMTLQLLYGGPAGENLRFLVALLGGRGDDLVPTLHPQSGKDALHFQASGIIGGLNFQVLPGCRPAEQHTPSVLKYLAGRQRLRAGMLARG